MSLPIGIDSFRKLIKRDFVDKTLFIKEVFDNEGVEVSVITRPRRFGKTLNLSMLQHFLASTVDEQSTAGLFDHLKIAVSGDVYMQHQGKYPVIFVTFKDMDAVNFQSAVSRMKTLIQELYSEHKFLLLSPELDEIDKELFTRILKKQSDEVEIERALKNLTKYLFLHYKVKPWILIDEYDTPLQSAHLRGYYDDMIRFMRGMFGAVLKTNSYLNRAVVTGILRISKESLFSQVNNLKVYSLFHSNYSTHFGFLEDEVTALAAHFHLEHKMLEIKAWYNGYMIGSTTVYNPWSIINCIDEQGQLKPYWANTSGNALVKDLIIRSDNKFKEQFELLLQDKSIECFIDENIVFPDLKKSSDEVNSYAIWSLLLMSGYLKPVSERRDLDGLWCLIAIPNQEVKSIYRDLIKRWLSNKDSVQSFNEFLDNLLIGNIPEFEEEMANIMKSIASYHDTSHHPETFYHALMIGITASLYNHENYELQSNRESGYGRYDYFIFSKNPNRPSIIMEFKKVDKLKNQDNLENRLEKAAAEALAQIDTMKYLTTAKDRGCKNILKIGMAFSGKHFKLAYEQSKG